MLIYLALMTGMREGELLGLQWSDLDWEKGVVTGPEAAPARQGQWDDPGPAQNQSRRAADPAWPE